MMQEKVRITTGNHFGDCRVHESGLYYLQSRYYDPAICRYINADCYTSTEQGYTLHECSCGDSYQDTVVEALGHNYVLMTETEEGRTYYCTRCGDTHTDDLNPLPTVPVDPPVDVMSLEAGEETTCGGIQRVLVSTVTQEHTYFYASGKLLREIVKTTNADGTVTTETLDFIYDSNGNPYALKYNGTTYYYITNLQGDVMYMVDANGATVATYEYDPYGKITYSDGTMASINPLRYRGYYYDAETGFYYLQSRYYDPEICRFINADGLANTGQGFVGYNMFAYCLNNPVCRIDIGGNVSEEAAKEIIEKNKGKIKAAGNEFGVDPVVIAACIYAEQVLNVDWIDALCDLLFYFFDTSIGIGQVKVSTAILVEDLGYIEKTEALYANQEYISRQGMVAMNLCYDEMNIRYVAAYLKYWQDQWSGTMDISAMPEILGTLYNLGDRANAPNTSPKANLFGQYVRLCYAKMRNILYGRRDVRNEIY